MPKTGRTVRRTQPEQRILGTQAYAAISAVEGLRLSPAGTERLKTIAQSALSQDEKRQHIVQAYSGRKKRG
jgi:hypothetical protein